MRFPVSIAENGALIGTQGGVHFTNLTVIDRLEALPGGSLQPGPLEATSKRAWLNATVPKGLAGVSGDVTVVNSHGCSEIVAVGAGAPKDVRLKVTCKHEEGTSTNQANTVGFSLKQDDEEAGACPAKGYLPAGTPATGGARNMVLAYMDYRSELGFDGHPACDCPGKRYPTMNWNASNFSSLLSYTDSGGSRSAFFDSFLFVGTEWYPVDGHTVKFNWERAYVNDSTFKNQRHAQMADWLGLAGVFTKGLKQLDAAAVETNTRPTFVITIPYPDKRATRWGAVGGRVRE